MKKLLAVILTIMVLVTACGKEKKTEDKQDDKAGKLRIGIVQLMDHKSLDQAREGFEEGLKEEGIDCEIIYKSAQGSSDTAKTICEKFASDKVDLIYAIATSAAQMAKAATSEIPILFSAVTDPVEAELVDSLDSPGGNISGTSDKVDTKLQLSMLKEIDKNIKTVGVIYSADEMNSLAQLKSLEKAGDELGYEINAMSIQNLSDLPQVARKVADSSDAVYMLSDNKVSSSTVLLTDILKEKKLPSVATVEADVQEGVLLTSGIDYFDLGKKTAEMAKKILVDGQKIQDLGVEESSNLVKSYNSTTLKALGLSEDLEIFKDAKDIAK